MCASSSTSVISLLESSSNPNPQIQSWLVLVGAPVATCAAACPSCSSFSPSSRPLPPFPPSSTPLGSSPAGRVTTTSTSTTSSPTSGTPPPPPPPPLSCNSSRPSIAPSCRFACALMAAGLFYCLLLLAGCVAAEIDSGCCLCLYTIFATSMMLLEGALAAGFFFNQHWIQDLPYDRTGELNNLLSFIQNNLDLCKWAALAIVATQALSLLLATILRAMVSTRSVDYDSDEDFVVIRRPLLVAQGAPAYLPTTVDNRGFHPDLWSSRMRQKFGLNSSNYTYNTLDPNAPPPQ
ncbi:hypothetical protein ABZP36_021956 [Zizania latifolia]